MCRYIGDSQRMTPTNDAPELTGSVSTDVSKNIYDLAGNCYEWTMEAYRTYGRVIRGGYYFFSCPFSSRFGNDQTRYVDTLSFRPTLYVK